MKVRSPHCMLASMYSLPILPQEKGVHCVSCARLHLGRVPVVLHKLQVEACLSKVLSHFLVLL